MNDNAQRRKCSNDMEKSKWRKMRNYLKFRCGVAQVSVSSAVFLLSLIRLTYTLLWRLIIYFQQTNIGLSYRLFPTDNTFLLEVFFFSFSSGHSIAYLRLRKQLKNLSVIFFFN